MSAPAPRFFDRDRNAEGRPENARPRDRFGAPLPRGARDEMPDRVDPAEVCSTVDEAVARAVELFDQQRFFEAHEFFEWAWKGPATADEDRPFFKGLAQLAVGYTHTQRRNAAGAVTLLERGITALRGWPDGHHGVAVSRLVAEATAFRERLGEVAPSPDLDFPTFARAR